MKDKDKANLNMMVEMLNKIDEIFRMMQQIKYNITKFTNIGLGWFQDCYGTKEQFVFFMNKHFPLLKEIKEYQIEIEKDIKKIYDLIIETPEINKQP